MQGIYTILMWVAIFGILWFFLIRPQRKQQKEHEDMLENLEVGDKVVTIGGIRGKVISINDDNVKLRISSNVDIDLVKNSIGRLDEARIEGNNNSQNDEKDN